MKQEQKALLEPFAQAISEFHQKIRAMSDDQLDALGEAARSVSSTNCWVCTFEAANFLVPEIKREAYRRKQLSLTRVGSAT